jgi:molybdate transport system permease protein
VNRLFQAVVVGTTALLALAMLALVAGLVAELVRHSAVQPPDLREVFFAVKLSLGTATASSLLATIIAIPVAYLLSRYRFPGKALLDTLLDLPIVLSPIALGALLLVFFRTPPGRAMEALLGPFVFEVRGIVLAQLAVVVGLAIRLLKSTFDGIDPEYEQLARTLGYDRVQVFRRVVLPMAAPGVVATLMLVWGRAIGEFGATVMLAGATTMKTETLPVAIHLNFEAADITSAMIFIAVLLALSFGVLVAVRRLHGRSL